MTKIVISAYITIATITAVVFINSFIIMAKADDLLEKLSTTESSIDEAQRYHDIYEDFRSTRRYISFTVDHDTITVLEDGFAEILGAIEAEDEGALIIAKSRLIGSISHLKRLSGINADSIF